MKLAECWEGGIKKHLIFLHKKGFKLVSAVAVLRGGNWNNGANAGPFSANLNNAPTNTNNNIGFRCCNNFESGQIHCFYGNMNSAKKLHQLIPNLLIEELGRQRFCRE